MIMSDMLETIWCYSSWKRCRVDDEFHKKTSAMTVICRAIALLFCIFALSFC